MSHKKIAVYSGSFNPLHIGHLAIARHLTEKAGFDCVYLVVSPVNPFKEGIRQTSAEDRVTAAKEAIARHPELKVRLDEIELQMPAPHYTVRTLKALKEREPECSFTLAIGADNLQAFRRWRDYDTILRDFGIIVFAREGVDCEKEKQSLLEEDPAYKIEIADAPLVNISSTEIRNAADSGQDISKWLM